MPPQTSRRALRRAARARPSTVDGRPAQAIGHFINVLGRWGCTGRDIKRAVSWWCDNKLPRSWAQRARLAPSAIDAAAHVLTLWFQDPAYVDTRGRPRPLPLQGRDRSVKALAREADPRVDPEETVRQLFRQKTLRRVGTRYKPRGRVLHVRSNGTAHHARNFDVLEAMLGVLDHNSRPRRRTAGRFEQIAVNTCIPVRAAKAVEERFRRQGTRFLVQSDDHLDIVARGRRKGERTMRLGIGIYVIRETPLSVQRSVRRKRRAKK